jgi:Uma2 family endonuclease
MATEPSLRRFTVTDYHQMAAAGILTEDDRVELIDGEIVQMSPMGGRHALCVARLNRLLSRHLAENVLVYVQSPVRLSEYDEPEPDVAVVRDREYGNELPTPADVLLVIEVADTSLRYDRTQKLPLYAAAGIAEVWLIDLQGESIERHTDPVEGVYRLAVHRERGQELESVMAPGLVFKVDDVLG